MVIFEDQVRFSFWPLTAVFSYGGGEVVIGWWFGLAVLGSGEFSLYPILYTIVTLQRLLQY